MRLLLAALWPVALILLVLFIAIASELCQAHCGRASRHSLIPATLATATLATQQSSSSAASIDELLGELPSSRFVRGGQRTLLAAQAGLRRTLPLMLVVTFVLLPSTANRLFRAWHCERFELDSSEGTYLRYLHDDLSLDCDEVEHSLFTTHYSLLTTHYYTSHYSLLHYSPLTSTH